MDFRQKLGWLDSDQRAAAAPGGAVVGPLPAQPLDETPLPVATATEPSADDKSDVLQQLRQKMADLLGRPNRERPLAVPSETSLPFLRFEREEGVIYRRLERLLPSHHVGRIPVDAAGSASAELLSLLSLDPGLAKVRFDRALFLDTETTGLGGAGTLAFLVGLSWFDEQGRFHLEQLLLRRPGDEPALLLHLREVIERAEVLVTYNGKAFDWPLLLGRYVMNRLRPPAPRPHLDLLHVARRLHKARLGQCRLVSLESAVLGFERGPDVAGADIAAIYGHFLRTGDESALEAVVGHNAWDVISMAALVGLYGEPVDLLHSEDLVGLARTLRRAGALNQAAEVADVAVTRGAGVLARRARGDIAKARGDRDRALAEFEGLLDELDDPSLRLELAKLYEHHLKKPGLALELLSRGTGEAEGAAEHRRARLERKLAGARDRAAQLLAPRARKPRAPR